MLSIFATGCAGAGDYRIEIIDGYYVAKISTNNIKIFKDDTKDITGKAPSIPIYHEGKEDEYDSESVIKLGYNDRYILAKTNKEKYYILDTKDEYVLEFKSEELFITKKLELGIDDSITLKSLDEYNKIR